MQRTTLKPSHQPFLRDYQIDAVKRMKNGCILNGGVGSGKSRTGLYYYFSKYGGGFDPDYRPMKPYPPDLYIITTAKKRNTLEWDEELVPFLLYTDPGKNSYYGNKVIVESWNNLHKFINVKGAFFIFDEDHVTGKGAWVKAFLKIVKYNEWIILSASPGDQWIEYVPVFIANGFFRNRSEFEREHVVYSRFTKYPKIEKYINTGYLMYLRNKILVDMDYQREVSKHHEDVYVRYDVSKYKDVIRKRWNPFENSPIVNASEFCSVIRRIVNSDESRQVAVLELFEDHPKAIIFYNFNYELEILKNIFSTYDDVIVAQYNGKQHDPLPTGDKWVYLVQYNLSEGWNCTATDTIIFYSQTYSYKTMLQAAGRIDRMNSPYKDLYYYHLKTRSGIDLAISKALREKKTFNESRWAKF